MRKDGFSNKKILVGQTRKKWENLKKAKLELEMAEKEFANVSKRIVNNVPGQEPGNTKRLASGLFN